MRQKHGEVKDPRSTGRKRGRKILQETGRPLVCAGFNDNDCKRTDNLQVNHINKNIMDNDPVNLEWLCPSCHKLKDKQTEKGVSIKGDEFGYGLDYYT